MNAQGTRVYWRPPEWKPPSQRGHDPGPPDLTRGRCARSDVDPELFYPPGDTPGAFARAALTIATYCNPCPVRLQCREWGRQVGRGTGIWGGIWLDDQRRNRQAS